MRITWYVYEKEKPLQVFLESEVGLEFKNIFWVQNK